MTYHFVRNQYDFGKITTTNPSGDTVVDLDIIDMNEVVGKIPILVIESLSLAAGSLSVGLEGSFDKIVWYAAKELGNDSPVVTPTGFSSVSGHLVVYPLDQTGSFETIIVPFPYRYMKYTINNVTGNGTATIVTRTIVI